MLIRLRDTGSVITDYEFRAAHPTTSFPPVLTAELLDGFGADPVLEGPQAVPTDPYGFSMRDGVEQIEGQWFTRYVLGPIFSDYTDAEGVLHTAAEQEAAYRAGKDVEQAASVRAQRNQRLNACDWTQLNDAPLTNVQQAAWATYRQALRDITTQPGFPWSVEWPTPPAP